VVRASTTVGWTDTAALMRSLISLSRQRLRIVTAYFNPDEAIVQALLDANGRHVDVQLLVPGRYSDSCLSQLAGHKHMQRLLDAGIRIWRYQRTVLHAKVIMVDSNIACIGSANLNHRSMAKDEECCIVALSDAVARQLERRFDEDCDDAELCTARDWARRGLKLRLKERLSRLIKEQL
jgi:cardiolipin synthase A/B